MKDFKNMTTDELIAFMHSNAKLKNVLLSVKGRVPKECLREFLIGLCIRGVV